jgi:hypothetical protein
MAREGGGEWYQSINFYKLSFWQVSVFGPKGTPSREEHKTPGLVLTQQVLNGQIGSLKSSDFQKNF